MVILSETILSDLPYKFVFHKSVPFLFCLQRKSSICLRQRVRNHDRHTGVAAPNFAQVFIGWGLSLFL